MLIDSSWKMKFNKDDENVEKKNRLGPLNFFYSNIFLAFKVIKECFKIWNWFIEVQEILECFFGEQ
jgi:hypothetical protein